MITDPNIQDLILKGTDPARSMQGLSDMAVIWDKERFFLLPLRKYPSDYLKISDIETMRRFNAHSKLLTEIRNHIQVNF